MNEAFPEARPARGVLTVERITTDLRRGVYWRAHCRCGWHSRDLPFPDADSAFHASELHRVLCEEYPS